MWEPVEEHAITQEDPASGPADQKPAEKVAERGFDFVAVAAAVAAAAFAGKRSSGLAAWPTLAVPTGPFGIASAGQHSHTCSAVIPLPLSPCFFSGHLGGHSNL